MPVLTLSFHATMHVRIISENELTIVHASPLK
jgi:hypothetical protein